MFRNIAVFDENTESWLGVGAKGGILNGAGRESERRVSG